MKFLSLFFAAFMVVFSGMEAYGSAPKEDSPEVASEPVDRLGYAGQATGLSSLAASVLASVSQGGIENFPSAGFVYAGGETLSTGLALSKLWTPTMAPVELRIPSLLKSSFSRLDGQQTLVLVAFLKHISRQGLEFNIEDSTSEEDEGPQELFLEKDGLKVVIREQERERNQEIGGDGIGSLSPTPLSQIKDPLEKLEAAPTGLPRDSVSTALERQKTEDDENDEEEEEADLEQAPPIERTLTERFDPSALMREAAFTGSLAQDPIINRFLPTEIIRMLAIGVENGSIQSHKMNPNKRVISLGGVFDIEVEIKDQDRLSDALNNKLLAVSQTAKTLAAYAGAVYMYAQPSNETVMWSSIGIYAAREGISFIKKATRDWLVRKRAQAQAKHSEDPELNDDFLHTVYKTSNHLDGMAVFLFCSAYSRMIDPENQPLLEVERKTGRVGVFKTIGQKNSDLPIGTRFTFKVLSGIPGNAEELETSIGGTQVKGLREEHFKILRFIHESEQLALDFPTLFQQCIQKGEITIHQQEDGDMVYYFKGFHHLDGYLERGVERIPQGGRSNILSIEVEYPKKLKRMHHMALPVNFTGMEGDMPPLSSLDDMV